MACSLNISSMDAYLDQAYVDDSWANESAGATVVWNSAIAAGKAASSDGTTSKTLVRAASATAQPGRLIAMFRRASNQGYRILIPGNSSKN